MSPISWSYLAFDELSTDDLYAVLQLRSEVFVVEQACAFQDIDGADREAMHLLGKVEGQLQAYARCFAPGMKYAEASIGRVLIREELRGNGAGHLLMRQAIFCLIDQWGPLPIRIGAQSRLQAFYAQQGFECSGAGYIEDGIPHVQMLRPADPLSAPEGARAKAPR